MSRPLPESLATTLSLAVAAIALWQLSLRLRDASIADVFWGPYARTVPTFLPQPPRLPGEGQR